MYYVLWKYSGRESRIYYFNTLKEAMKWSNNKSPNGELDLFVGSREDLIVHLFPETDDSPVSFGYL